MATQDKHINKEADQFFSQAEIKWEKSKEQIWDEKFAMLAEPKAKKRISLKIAKYASVAIILALVAVTTYIGLYTEDYFAPAGEHLSVTLPDGSTVELNAESKLSFKPYLWSITRKVNLEGEAFFQVMKGEKFEVISKNGSTEVLGTSFNIYARDKNYSVTCVTGKVKVKSHKQVLILKPNQQVDLRKGKLNKKQNIQVKQSIAWKNNIFVFTSKPMSQVFREIERQYNVMIKNKHVNNLFYTGNFPKNASIDTVLNLVCKPMGIKFVKKNKLEYYIIK
jgi:ferric-dicitrate binding protein FerR (iron transport regulator)